MRYKKSTSSTMSESSLNDLRNKLNEWPNDNNNDTAVDSDDNFSNSRSPIAGSNVDEDLDLRRVDSSSSVNFIDLNKLLYIPEFDYGIDFEHVGESAKKRFKGMRQKTRQKLKHQSKDFAKLQEFLNQRLSRFDQRIHKNLESSSTEKLFYALAVFAIATGGFIIGKYPHYFHIYHTVLFCLLMPIRFYSYFKQSFQYYLADLCYYVNVLLMVFIWWAPNSKSLFVSVFSLTLGTLSFAVITWRNSLVLHSIEKTTSSFIHVMPPITMFVLVHELPADFNAQRFPAIQKITDWNFFNGIIVTSIYYTIWQVGYHYFITIRKKKEIEQGRATSFTYLRAKKKSSALGKLVNSLPYNWMQIAAFTLIQFFYQLLTMTFCPIWFKYKHLCGCFVSFVFIWSSYNGATYYIDVFGKRFEKEVRKLKAEIDDLQARIESHNGSPVLKPNDSVIIDDQKDSPVENKELVL